jgi:hypothetical protein
VHYAQSWQSERLFVGIGPGDAGGAADFASFGRAMFERGPPGGIRTIAVGITVLRIRANLAV